MTDSNQDYLFKRLHASLVPNTLEKEIMEHIENQHIQINLGKQEATNWQEAYQKLFVEQDQYLTRAIKAEGDLAVAKSLLADQEIELRKAEDTVTNMCASFGIARSQLRQAVKELDKVGVPY